MTAHTQKAQLGAIMTALVHLCQAIVDDPRQPLSLREAAKRAIAAIEEVSNE